MCAVCGDVIGVYEPVLVMETTRPRVTSLAREPELSSVEADLAHRDCGPAVA